jgi:hydrogenase nickel incorporation protein HypA/HybF
MHELAIAQSILTIVLDVARQHGDLPVEVVRLRLGAYRQISPEALNFAFTALADGTVAADAVLEWEEIPVTIRCKDCGRAFTGDVLAWICPHCGALGGEMLGGNELEVATVSLTEGG